MKKKLPKTNEVAINNALTMAAKVIDDQYAVQCKIFGYMNAFARGDHMKNFARLDHEVVLCQVYADLASHFQDLKAVAMAGK